MYCPNCGKDIGKNNICESCGTQISGIEKKIIKTHSIFKKTNVIIFVGVIFLALAVSFIVKNRKITVDLNEYVSVEFSGYDSVGKATVTFDQNAFQKDYEKKIRVNKKAYKKYLQEYLGMEYLPDEELDSYIDSMDNWREFLNSCIGGTLSKTSNLSNGDYVSYIWDCNEGDALELFKCKLKYTEVEFVVNSLKEPEIFNPFEEVTVSYEGIAPNGTVYVQNNSNAEEYRSISFSVNPSEGLNNGDEITVIAKVTSSDENFIESYGKRIDSTEKIYVVEGLDSYITDTSDIPDAVLTMMEENADNVIAALVEKEIKNESYITGTVDSITYVGNYYLYKDSTTEHSGNDTIIQMYENQNRYYLLYKIDITEVLTIKKTGEEEIHNISYYCDVSYPDLIIDANGNVDVDLSEYDISLDIYEYDTGRTQGIFATPLVFDFHGYKTIENFYEMCITPNLGEYSCEENIKR